MTITFIGEGFSIYQSNAASNLIYAFAFGCQENNCKSLLISLDNEYSRFKGFLGPIEFYIPLEQINRNRVLLIRNFFKLKKYFNLIKFCTKIKKKNEKKVLICFSQSIFVILISFIIKKIAFDLSFIYVVEHPLRNKRKVKKMAFTFYKYLFSIFFDGQIFISERLKNFFFVNDKWIVIPSMVVSSKFNEPQRNPFPFEYIGYCGTITREKDGVDILIKGFNLISAKNPLLKLVIIGDFSDNKERIYFERLVKELGLNSKVIFTGLIKKNDMPKFLKNAKILALTRPKSLQSETGFPTKLPEYLATGKPVIVTKVGDIPNYLQDGHNAFLIDPNCIEAVAISIEKILGDYSNALKVAENGKILVETVFNPTVQAKKMIDFISTKFVEIFIESKSLKVD